MTEPVLVSAPTGPDNRRVAKMGGIGGVLVLALLVLPKLFGGGGGGAADTALTPTPEAPPTSAAPSVGSGGGGGGDSISVGGGSVRDPFAALIDDTASSGGGAAPAPVATVADTASIPVPVVDTGAGADTGSGAATAPPTTIPPRQTHRFFLLEVYPTQSGASGARVRIDDEVIETVVGQDFAGNYRTVSLDRQSGCGVFLFGDQRLSLCEGQETQT